MDEFAISDLLSKNAEVDTFGVGTKLVSGYAPPGFVFKLVAIEDGTTMRAVAKRSTGKLSTGGAKDAYRLIANGFAMTELIVPRGEIVAHDESVARRLTHPLVRGGQIVCEQSVDAARAQAVRATSELDSSAFDLTRSDLALVTQLHVELARTSTLPPRGQ